MSTDRKESVARPNRLWTLATSHWNIPKWRSRLESHLERPFFVPMTAFIAALNSFLPFFPVELFLILRVLVRPKEWWRNAAIAAVASAVGMVCLSQVVKFQPDAGLATWLAHRFGPTSWEHVSRFVHHRGSLGILFVSISFLPLPPAVVMCAISKVPDWQIALSVTVGHCLKYGFFSWLAVKSPYWFTDANAPRGEERAPS